MRHYLVYNSDEGGDHLVGDPLFIMHFADADLPESYLERSKVVRKHAYGRLNHWFFNYREVTLHGLQKEHGKAIVKELALSSFVKDAIAAEGLNV